MNIFKILLPLATLLLLINCAGEDLINEYPETEGAEQPNPQAGNGSEKDPVELEKTTYFTLEVQNNSDYYNGLNYLVINTKEGHLLDFKNYQDNSTIVFESVTPLETESLIVTNFRHYTLDGNTYSSIKTYTEIAKNSKWTFFTIPQPELNEPVGEYDLTITNNPGLQTIHISNNRDFIRSSRPDNPPGTSFMLSNNSIYEKGPDLISVLDENEDWKYAFLDDIEDHSNIEFDYGEFKSFDFQIPIQINEDFERINFSVTGYEINQKFGQSPVEGYTLCTFSSRSNLHQNPLKMVYLDKFERSRSIFSIAFKDYGYSFFKIGGRPTELYIPERPSYTINDKSFTNYNAESTMEYYSRDISWSYNYGEIGNNFHNVSWNVYTMPNQYPTLSIPDKLLEQLPENILKMLEYSGTGLHLSPEHYQETVIRNFKVDMNASVDRESKILFLNANF